MSRQRAIVIWGAVGLISVVPLLAAANSPLLAWREPVYILAGFAGVVGLILLLLQPLLAAGVLPGLSRAKTRRLHRTTGLWLVIAVLIHVAGLWITSPPDMIDALLLASPTPFSIWGVLAMWAALAAGTLALLRGRLPLRPRHWRGLHMSAATLVVIGTVLHAVLIDGTMETTSKLLLCAATLIATAVAVLRIRARYSAAGQSNQQGRSGA